jgi:L-lactate dehydrogenase
MAKVTIIGAGSVGSTIAYTLATGGYVSEIVMIDINEEKALGEALDIRQGTPFCPPVSIYAGSYRDAANSDIVVLTSGLARKPGQTRLDLAQANVNILKNITGDIAPAERDAATWGILGALSLAGIEFIRVHDVKYASMFLHAFSEAAKK